MTKIEVYNRKVTVEARLVDIHITRQIERNPTSHLFKCLNAPKVIGGCVFPKDFTTSLPFDIPYGVSPGVSQGGTKQQKTIEKD